MKHETLENEHCRFVREIQYLEIVDLYNKEEEEHDTNYNLCPLICY